VGYVVVPVILYRLYKRFAERGNEHERWGYRFMAFTTVTSWGVYPLGYLLTLTSINLNYIHIAFSVADIFNKTGVAIVAYLVGKHIMDERLDEREVLPGHEVG
jgi:sensory rhodopsin